MKTTFKDRIENAYEAFFENTSLSQNSKLESRNNPELIREKDFENSAETRRTLMKILKQGLLFFPATFVLFAMSFATTVLEINPPVGFQPYLGWQLIPWLAFGIFGTWYGIGNLKKLKHLIIPFSIVSIGILLASATSLSPPLVEWMFTQKNVFIFLPLALVVPFLVKGIADFTDEQF